jgi:hypothetical protein
MLRNIPHLKNTMEIQSGQFLPLRASAKKKRQTSNMLVKPRKKDLFMLSIDGFFL